MRIAIDIRDLSLAKTGARTYLEEILVALPRVAPQHEFVKLAPARPVRPASHTIWSKMASHLGFVYWKEIVLPIKAWRAGCDIILCTDYTVPLFTTARTVPVFYDANFWSNPKQYNRIWRLLMDYVALPAARHSPLVVTISEFSRSEIARHAGISSRRIVAVPIAPKSSATGAISAPEITRILGQYRIDTSQPYFLHVGVLEKRKNLVRLVEAFARYKAKGDRPHQLVLVGQPGPKTDMDDSQNIRNVINKLQLEDCVRMTGHVSDDELPAFYQGAFGFVFPSLREGFGIPILEAFQNQVPVAAAKSSAIPEVAGDAAILFDPQNVDEIAWALERLATDENLRNVLISKGNEQASLFSWDETARQLVNLFEALTR